jgi:hypothetical protein
MSAILIESSNSRTRNPDFHPEWIANDPAATDNFLFPGS